MEALKCDFCGGGLIIDESREFAKCEFCGTKYMASTLRAKIQEIRGTVKVEGAVETTVGNAEKDRLLKNADAFYKIGEIEKSLLAYREINDRFPECIEGWLNSLIIMIDEGVCIQDKNLSTYIIQEIIRHCDILKRLIGNTFSIDLYRNKLFNNLCNGKTFYNYFINDFKLLLNNQQIEYIETQSAKNAKLVNDLGILKELCGIKDYGTTSFSCKKYIGISLEVYEYDPYGSKYFWRKARYAADENQLKNRLFALHNERKNKGVCQYCGNSFKGTFRKVCSHCNKPKDY